jgi:uncharacterized protein (TIRG00374 family)
MIDKIIWIIKISFIIFSIFFFINIDFSKLNFFNYNQLLAILILIIFHLFRILRFYIIFYFLNNKINFFSLLRVYYIGLYLGIITPGRLGEFYRIKLINDLNIPNLSNYNFLLIEKITDIFSLICFIFLLLTTGFYTLNLQTIFLFFTFVLVGIFFIKNGYYFFTYSTKKIICFFPKLKKKKFFELFFKNNPFENLGNKKLIFLFLLTMTIWLIFIFAVHIGINGNFKVNFLETIKLFVINTFVTALPITIMGIGLREIVLTEIFQINNLSYLANISFQFIFINTISAIPGFILIFNKEYKFK